MLILFFIIAYDLKKQNIFHEKKPHSIPIHFLVSDILIGKFIPPFKHRGGNE